MTPGAPTSSPGMAFLLTTVAAYGDDWPDYWADLMANGTQVTSGLERRLLRRLHPGRRRRHPADRAVLRLLARVHRRRDGRSTTKALLDTCFRQVEYAGVLAGADNPAGARALVDFLLGEDVQAALPESMYVFPVRDGVALPKAWARFARRPPTPYTVDPAEIAANRDEWLTEWQDVITR